MARKPACRSSNCKSLLEKLADMPDGFHLHKKLQRSIERRQKMAKGEEPLDWSAAEALAFASLAVEGHPVRLSGQDSDRGTFSQRHAVLHDVVDGHRYEDLRTSRRRPGAGRHHQQPALRNGHAWASSTATRSTTPKGSSLWEAQYGDFVNAAQVIIDQFIASAEDKWRRLSGVVLLLPHAFEGKGPEHSSARLERFLFLAAEDNIQVVYALDARPVFPLPAPPGETQLAEAARRAHAEELAAASARDVVAGRPGQRPLPPHPRRHARERRPRQPAYCSPAAKCTTTSSKPAKSRSRHDVAILRVEQFYPLRDQVLADALRNYPDETPVRWVQEEPENMGAWPYWKNRFCHRLLDRYPFSVRRPAAIGQPGHRLGRRPPSRTRSINRTSIRAHKMKT